MRRRTRIVLLEVLGFTVAGLLLALAVGALRLSQGPISVDALTPYVQDAFGEAVTLEVGRSVFTWGGWEQPLTVVAYDARLSGLDGRPIASVPEVDVGLSVARLIRGEVAPTHLRLVRPELEVIRTGDVTFGFIPTDLSGDDDGDVLEPLIVRLLGSAGSVPSSDAGEQTRAEGLPLLRRVQVVDGRIVVDDRWLGTQWEAEDVDIDLARQPGSIVGNAGLTLLLDDRPARQTAALSYPLGGGEATLEIAFSDLVVEALAPAHPVLAPLGLADSVFRGTADLRLDRYLSLTGGRFAVQGGAGRLQLDGLYERPVAVAQVAAEGAFDLTAGTLSVEPLVIDFGGPQLTAGGSVAEGDGMLDVAVDLSLTSMPVDLFDQYWPPPLEPGGRAWVTRNLSRGMVREVRVSLALRMPADRPAEAEIVSTGSSKRSLTTLSSSAVLRGATASS